MNQPKNKPAAQLYQKKIAIAPLTLRLLESYYSNTQEFKVKNTDIYYRRLTTMLPDKNNPYPKILKTTANFSLTKSTFAKVRANQYSLGFYLYKESQYDMCNFLNAQVKTGKGIKAAIEYFYYIHNLEEEDYKMKAAEKCFQRFRKRQSELQKQEINNKFAFKYENKVTNSNNDVILQSDKKNVPEALILEATAAEFKVTVEEILSNSRKLRITNARHTTIYLLIQNGATYRSAGKTLKTPFNHFSKIRKKIEFDIKIENTTGLRAKQLLDSLFYTI